MSKRPKRNKRNKYNIEQFVNVLCKGCSLCDTFVNPTVCFEKLYKYNTRGFVENIYRKLIRFDRWPFANEDDKQSVKKERELFRNIFCKAGCCDIKNGQDCHTLTFEECFENFQAQILESSDDEEHKPPGESYTKRSVNRKKKRKDKGKQTIVQPYPTFIMSNKEEFRKAITEIIYGKNKNVNDNIEQDRNKELPIADNAGNN